ncbi:MAG: hypothetical protein GTO63_15565 [Anaerolineae bacterium]|nr:hypothetical protein [Anaerolineae bacterium]NIN96247.1 hypothetical protein [Anaerolineae bacterium]NIQ79267.1 hypothetical protein [Anaerolineae bacterium]
MSDDLPVLPPQDVPFQALHAIEGGYEIYFGPRSQEIQVLLGVPWPQPLGNKDPFVELVWNLMEGADYHFQKIECGYDPG